MNSNASYGVFPPRDFLGTEFMCENIKSSLSILALQKYVMISEERGNNYGGKSKN